MSIKFEGQFKYRDESNLNGALAWQTPRWQKCLIQAGFCQS